MDLTLDEAKAVINGTDSRSEAYRRNDPDTMAAVEKAWQDAYPGERSLNEDFGLEENMKAALKQQSQETSQAPGLEELDKAGDTQTGQD